MKYQNRKRLMMAEMGIPAFSTSGTFADSAIGNIRNPVSRNTVNSSEKSGQTATREVRLQELTMLSITPVLRRIHNWWHRRAERHYLICADVEEQRAREAQMNVAYYQKRAAMARSAQM